jgi:hypothetical protein
LGNITIWNVWLKSLLMKIKSALFAGIISA